MGSIHRDGVLPWVDDPASCRLRCATCAGCTFRGVKIFGNVLDSFLTCHLYHLLSLSGILTYCMKALTCKRLLNGSS